VSGVDRELPLLTFLHKGLNWKQRTDRKNKTLDKVFRAFII
jgi:hypothetical protein